jgi:hypothetical protein
MKFHHSVISDTEMFDKVSRSVMFGYGLPATKTMTVSKGLADHINIIVIGATCDSAEQRVRNCFKGEVPPNVGVFGADSDIDHTNEVLKKHNFTGHIIFCPEISYLRDYSFVLFAQLIKIIGTHVDRHRSGCEMHLLLPSTDILENLLGAMFEDWKTDNDYRWFFYDEDDKFSREHATSARKLERRNRGLGLDGEFDVVLAEGEAQLAAPWILDAAKTFMSYMNPREEFDRSLMHPIRIGEDFRKFDSNTLFDILSDLKTYPGISLDEAEAGPPRDICVHNSVAWKMFIGSIRPNLPYYNDGPDEMGMACAGGGKKQPKKRIVFMEEISK